MAFPVDEQYIREAENTLGLKFPRAFKDKMKLENGGDIEADGDFWTIHPFFDTSDKKRIKRTANHIILETRNAKAWSGFPQHAIAIADNGTGDKLILLPADNNPLLSDTIYRWSHETGDIQAIADDINQFIV